MVRRLSWWHGSGLAFIAVVVLITAMLRIGGLHACEALAEPDPACMAAGGSARDCKPKGDPILAFELAKTPAEVEAQFPLACREEATVAQAKGLRLDNLAFIPAYGAALILALQALGRDLPARRGCAQAAILLVMVAMAYDWWENSRLLAVLAQMPGDQATIDQLIAAPRIKFALLGLAEAIAGWLILGLGGWRRLAGLAAIAGGGLTLIGLTGHPHWIAQGGPIAFAAIAVTAWAGATAGCLARSSARRT